MNTIPVRFLIFIFLTLSACSGPSDTLPAHEGDEAEKPYDTVLFNKKAERISIFFQKLNTDFQFNGAVLVVKNGHILYQHAFGFNDIKRRRDSLTIHSVFQLASVSKQFTAAGILKLADEGKLGLDDTIQKFYPAFPYSGITIKMLLAHRSGLANYTYFCDVYCDRRTPVKNQEIVQLIVDRKPPPYLMPDRRHDYSNTGYALLAAIIEKVTGKTFKEYMEEDVFRPAGMNHTFVFDSDHPEAFTHLNGHKAFGGKTSFSYLDGVVGDKGIYSTIGDLYLWDRLLYTDELLSKEVRHEAFSDQNKEMKRPFNYGFGWRIYTFEDNKKLIYHGGWWNGFKSYFLRDIQNENTVVILSNCENRGFGNLDELFDIIYDRKPDALRKFSARIHHSPGF